MDCARIDEHLEAYALGALDPDDRVAVERHLATCADCRRRAAAWATIAHTLPLALGAASPHRPPPALRARLLAALAVTPGSAVATPAGPHHSLRRLARWLLASAAVVLLSIVLVGVVLARESALRAQYADLVAQQEVILEVVDAPRTSKLLLRATTPGSTAYGKLYTRPDLPHVVVMAARLTPPPAGQAYHLWLTRAGRLEFVGVLAINSQGFGLLVFDADRPGPTYEGALLTLQPEGGAAPAGQPILRGQP